MKISRFVAFALAASILTAAFPAPARAGEPTTPPAPPSIDIRAAVDRAAASLAAVPAPRTPDGRRPARAQAAAYGGGGGGKGMLIVTLVSTAVGLGATYYLMKEMKKQTDEATQQARQLR